jgi:hypothetical protein
VFRSFSDETTSFSVSRSSQAGGDGRVIIDGECLFDRSVAFQESGANQREGIRRGGGTLR